MSKYFKARIAVVHRGNAHFHGSERIPQEWRFCLETGGKEPGSGGKLFKPYGLVLPDVVKSFRGDKMIAPYFNFSGETREMVMRKQHCADSEAFGAAMRRIRFAAQCLPGEVFGSLRTDYIGYTLELPLLQAPAPHMSVPQAIAGLLGIVTSGVHANLYHKDRDGCVRIWVREGSSGQLEQCFRGLVLAPDRPTEPMHTLLRIVQAETGRGDGSVVSRTTRLVSDATAGGEISFCGIRDGPGTRPVDAGRPEPGIRHVFDLQVGDDFFPAEYEGPPANLPAFQLLSVGEARDALLEDRFSPTCAMVMLDFLIRHRLLAELPDRAAAKLEKRLRSGLPF